MSDRNGIAVLWQPQEGRTWILRGHAGWVGEAEFSPDDNFILTAGLDATAKIWDSRNGDLLDTIGVHGNPMPEPPFRATQFRPDGRAVLTGSIDGVIREWELHLEKRSPLAIDEALKCRVPWHLVGEDLAPATPDDATCALH
jgi:WD40 repeat protein